MKLFTPERNRSDIAERLDESKTSDAILKSLMEPRINATFNITTRTDEDLMNQIKTHPRYRVGGKWVIDF